MLHPERAAAHCVSSLIRVLLISCPQGQLVDEVDGHRSLSSLHLLGLPVVAVLLANLVNLVFEFASYLILGPVFLSLVKKIEHKNWRLSSQVWGILDQFYIHVHKTDWALHIDDGLGVDFKIVHMCTFNLDVGFNMTYLMAPWMFSVQLASHVTYAVNTVIK